MTEHTTAPADFDLADWLAGGTAHRPTRTVTVYRDLHLSAELERIRTEIAAHEAARPTGADGQAEESVSGDDDYTAQLNRKAEQLLERIHAAKVDLTVRGLIRPELLAIQAKHEEGTPAHDYEVLAKAVEFPGPQQITAEQWARFHEVIGQAQFNRIVQTYAAAQNIVPEVDAPFSPRSSRKGTGS